MCLGKSSTRPTPPQDTPPTHSNNPHDSKMLPPPFVKAVDRIVHASRERHTARVLDSADYLKPRLRATVAWHRKSGGLLIIWVVMLNSLGGHNPRVSALTFNIFGFSGQSALVAASGAKKGLLVSLKRPERVRSAQGIVSRFMLFVPCDKSKIIHCKKARANNDMSFLQ